MKLTISTVEILKALGLPNGIEIEISDRNSKDWISNVGRNRGGHPETLNYDTKVEVKIRNGATEVGNAPYWNSQWMEIAWHRGHQYDIVAYRILKD